MAGDALMGDEAGIHGIFPDREAWTRSAPYLHHLDIWTRSRLEPGQEIKRKRFTNFGHVSNFVITLQ